MSGKSSIWNKVNDILEKGGTPVISLSPATRIIQSKRAKGRPRIRLPGAKPYAHYATHTPSGNRMTCRANGCSKQLRRKQVLVCSKQCEAQLRQSCELYLAILNGELPPEELPVYMRSNKLRRGSKVTF
jgi:hypothetical protein